MWATITVMSLSLAVWAMASARAISSSWEMPAAPSPLEEAPLAMMMVLYPAASSAEAVASKVYSAPTFFIRASSMDTSALWPKEVIRTGAETWSLVKVPFSVTTRLLSLVRKV